VCLSCYLGRFPYIYERECNLKKGVMDIMGLFIPKLSSQYNEALQHNSPVFLRKKLPYPKAPCTLSKPTLVEPTCPLSSPVH
jgi:hypothetical protein